MFSLLCGCLLWFTCQWIFVSLLQRSFSGTFLPVRISSHLLCYSVSFAWVISRDSPIINIVSQTRATNEYNLVIGVKVYVAWKQKMLHDVMLHDVIGGHQAYIHRKIDRNMGNPIGGHQAYIHRKIDRNMGNPILQLTKTTRGKRDSRELNIWTFGVISSSEARALYSRLAIHLVYRATVRARTEE